MQRGVPCTVPNRQVWVGAVVAATEESTVANTGFSWVGLHVHALTVVETAWVVKRVFHLSDGAGVTGWGHTQLALSCPHMLPKVNACSPSSPLGPHHDEGRLSEMPLCRPRPPPLLPPPPPCPSCSISTVAVRSPVAPWSSCTCPSRGAAAGATSQVRQGRVLSEAPGCTTAGEGRGHGRAS